MEDMKTKLSKVEENYHNLDKKMASFDLKLDTILATIKGVQNSGFITNDKLELMVTRIVTKHRETCGSNFISKSELYKVMSDYFNRNPVVAKSDFKTMWNDEHKEKQTFWSKMVYGAIGALSALLGLLFNFISEFLKGQ